MISSSRCTHASTHSSLTSSCMPSATSSTLVSTTTSAMPGIALPDAAPHGRARTRRHLGHLVAEEIVGPVRDIAVAVELQRLEVDPLLRVTGEIDGDFLRRDQLFGNPPLQSHQEVLRMAFDDQLHI